MIGLDTNVIVRYLVGDDPEQSRGATRLINSLDETNQGFVSLVTLVEVYWVLRRGYRVNTAKCHDVLGRLLDSKEIRIGQSDIAREALAAATAGADFADAVIAELGKDAGCTATVTFDQRAARRGVMELLGD